MKLSAHEIEHRQAAFLELLREKGLKVTQQRLVIFRALQESHGHLTAEQVHEAVKADNPSLSVSTVYATLETLVQIGALAEITMDDGRKLFDRTTSAHHHFVDLDSGAVSDLEDSEAIRLDLKALARKGYVIEKARVTVYGRARKH